MGTNVIVGISDTLYQYITKKSNIFQNILKGPNFTNKFAGCLLLENTRRTQLNGTIINKTIIYKA